MLNNEKSRSTSVCFMIQIFSDIWPIWNIFCVQFFAKSVCTLYFSLLIWNIGCNLTQRGGTSPTSFNSPLEIMKLFYGGYWLLMFLNRENSGHWSNTLGGLKNYISRGVPFRNNNNYITLWEQIYQNF